MFYLHDKNNEAILENGVVRTVKGYINDLMVCELKWNKGMVGTLHTHPHSQCGYVIRGSFEAELDGVKQVLKAGDCFYAEPNRPHGLVCLEDGSVLLDIFTPHRADFLN